MNSQEKIIDLEVRISMLEKTVSKIETTITTFTEKTQKIIRNFIYVIIGTIFMSLFTGLSLQYKSFHEVHSKIYAVEGKVDSLRIITGK